MSEPNPTLGKQPTGELVSLLQDDLVRSAPAYDLVRSESEMPILRGVAVTYGDWAEIRSSIEGHFLENFAAGSFTKTIKERGDRIRCIFHHGEDPSIGMKPLGPIVKLHDGNGSLRYDVQLLDTDYNRSLLPGLEAGVYGSSFKIGRASCRERV